MSDTRLSPKGIGMCSGPTKDWDHNSHNMPESYPSPSYLASASFLSSLPDRFLFHSCLPKVSTWQPLRRPHNVDGPGTCRLLAHLSWLSWWSSVRLLVYLPAWYTHAVPLNVLTLSPSHTSIFLYTRHGWFPWSLPPCVTSCRGW